MDEAEKRFLARVRAQEQQRPGGRQIGDPTASPVDLAAVIPGVVLGTAAPERSVQTRLKLKFGMGEDPKRRQKLYDRLALLVTRHGELVITIISECVAESVGTRRPDRYFCKAVKCRIREAGLRLEGGNDGEAEW